MIYMNSEGACGPWSVCRILFIDCCPRSVLICALSLLLRAKFSLIAVAAWQALIGTESFVVGLTPVIVCNVLSPLSLVLRIVVPCGFGIVCGFRRTLWIVRRSFGLVHLEHFDMGVRVFGCCGLTFSGCCSKPFGSWMGIANGDN